MLFAYGESKRCVNQDNRFAHWHAPTRPIPGMTNAGKTYTITGPEDSPGLLPRTLAETFRSVEDARAMAAARGAGDRLAVVVSYLEIYNEQVPSGGVARGC